MKRFYRISRVVNGTPIEVKELSEDATKVAALESARAWAMALPAHARSNTLIFAESRKRGWPLNPWTPVAAFKQTSTGRVIRA